MSEAVIETPSQVEERIMHKMFPETKPADTVAGAQDTVKGAQDTVPGNDTQGNDTVAGDDTQPGGEDTVEGSKAEDLYEFEFNGGKYQVPTQLKEMHEGYLRKEDYTKKTMETADIRRHAQLLIEEQQQAAAIHKSLQPKFDAVKTVESYIKQYDAVNWNEWIAQDPIAAQKGMLQLHVLRDQKTNAERDLKDTTDQEMEKLKQTRQKLLEENVKILQRDVKGWSADTAKKLSEFAGKTYGFGAEEMAGIYDSRVVKMMGDAMKWHDLQSSKPQVNNRAAKAEKVLKPGATDQRNVRQLERARLMKDIKSGKTDSEKARAIEKLLESRIR